MFQFSSQVDHINSCCADGLFRLEPWGFDGVEDRRAELAKERAREDNLSDDGKPCSNSYRAGEPMSDRSRMGTNLKLRCELRCVFKD